MQLLELPAGARRPDSAVAFATDLRLLTLDQSWTIAGFRPAMVERVVRENHDCRSFEFRLADGAPFAPAPGQYVPVGFEIDRRRHVRCYAVSSHVVAGERPRITVRRTSVGTVSNWCHGRLRPGMTIHVGEPSGDFVLGRSEAPLLFLAAGIGIAPIRPMILHALAERRSPITLVTINRSSFDAAYLVELRSWAERSRGRLRLIELYSNTDGFTRLDRLGEALGGVAGARAYVCGPDAFMSRARAVVAAMGVPADRIMVNAAVRMS